MCRVIHEVVVNVAAPPSHIFKAVAIAFGAVVVAVAVGKDGTSTVVHDFYVLCAICFVALGVLSVVCVSSSCDSFVVRGTVNFRTAPIGTAVTIARGAVVGAVGLALSTKNMPFAMAARFFVLWAMAYFVIEARLRKLYNHIIATGPVVFVH